MAAQVTWLLPGLRAVLSSTDGERWRRWLGRAERLDDSAFGARQALADALGVAPEQLPWARACAAQELDPEAAHEVLAIADPLQTRVEMFDLRVLGVGAGQLSADQAAGLLEAINGYLADEGLQLIASAERWYLCGEAERWPDAGCLPSDSLLGSSLAAYLPDSLPWQRLLNELQVYFKQHQLLQQLKQRGSGSVDSLWFWGGASAAPRSVACSWMEVEEADFRALGEHLGLHDGERVAGDGVVEGASANAEGIGTALRRGRLRLHFASGERFALQPRDRWRFWVKPASADSLQS